MLIITNSVTKLQLSCNFSNNFLDKFKKIGDRV
jgi:hypothetical protein